MEDNGAIRPVYPVLGATAARPVRASLTQEHPDRYRVWPEHSEHVGDETPADLVTTLTQDEIELVEHHLPIGSSLEGILGRTLRFHPSGEHRHGRLPVAGDRHVDVDV